MKIIVIGLNENIEVLHKYSKIEFCYKRLAIVDLDVLYSSQINCNIRLTKVPL